MSLKCAYKITNIFSLTGVRLNAEKTQTFAVNSGEGKIRDVCLVNLVSEVNILGFSWHGLLNLGQNTKAYGPGRLCQESSGPTVTAISVSTRVQEAAETWRERISLQGCCPSGLCIRDARMADITLLSHFIQTKMSWSCLLNDPRNPQAFWAVPKQL